MYAVSPLGLNIMCHGRMHNSGKIFSHENNVVDNRKLLSIYIPINAVWHEISFNNNTTMIFLAWKILITLLEYYILKL